MSGRAWKPGDLALVTAGCWANPKVALRLAEGWAHVNGVNPDGDGVIEPVRPLVVIDAEDREQVERLTTALDNEFTRNGWANEGGQPSDDLIRMMQAALRSLVTDPRPDEPMGLGAVVEDADGHRWVHSGGPQPAEGRIWYSPNLNGTALYADIAAVRVLSEGVS